eukprot:CAMPEP_0118956292 /NCGR_PEP_ID=MMETSP1169-20130426/61461_1 /TAXON_ID=36882 /ORGANISM="Pyramimonas obovata, Strain CCMP722" /LENGTH=279 /DNA_ID=CAMNT_0006904307 /DNA_START=144 /DNA_END=979 /DNA_ORIENTATION=-
MNHLVGALNTSDDENLEALIREDEREEFNAFKAAYLAHPDANPAAVPTWKVDPDDLPASGWRPLDGVTLLRFLRADKRNGKFRPQASKERLLNALKWRKDHLVDPMAAAPDPPEWATYQCLRVRRWTGREAEGRPVQFERLGKFLGGGNAKTFNHGVWLKMYARDLEQHFDELRIASQAEGKPVSTYVFCADLEGFEGIVWSMSSVIALLKFLTKEVEEKYPEVVDKILLFAAPKMFAAIFKMFRPFMDPITASKVEVYGRSEGLKRIEALLPLEAIPT